VRVGNCQASIKRTPYRMVRGFLLFGLLTSSLKLSHLPLADSTFSLFLGIVSCLDV
jgi:hypothetical protein